MNVVIENGKVFASPKGGRGRAGEPGFPAIYGNAETSSSTT